MSQNKLIDSTTVGLLFARTESKDELKPEAWADQIMHLASISKSANALLCVHADDGFGKTTFLAQLFDKLNASMDIVTINPATASLQPGWLTQGLAHWLSSDRAGITSIHQKLSAIKDSDRPILVCVDTGDFIQPSQLALEIPAMLNLADAVGLRLSILVCCSPEKSRAIQNDSQLCNRLIFNKALPPMSEAELVKITISKLKRANVDPSMLDEKRLHQLALSAGGSPLRMTKLICSQLGLDIPSAQKKSSITSKPTSPSRNTKKQQELSAVILDDLLAPPNK